MQKKFTFSLFIVLLIMAALVSILVTLCMGAVDIPIRDTWYIVLSHIKGKAVNTNIVSESFNQIIWNIRAPRVLLGFTVGCGLTLCGTVMQAIVQNPMAEPYILGISSGATFGATSAIFLGFSSLLGVIAFIGASIACFAVLGLSSKGGKATSSKLILSGMVVNALFTAFSNFIISVAGDADGIMTIKFWTMGSLTRAKWSNITMVLVFVAAGFIIFLLSARPLNTMLMGDEAAITLGLNLAKYRVLFFLVISALTGILVASCGTIGFIGLIVPHICRSLVGNNHKKLIPIATLLGGVFMVWVDALARTLIHNAELPVGIFTALIGAPFFIYILIKRNYGFSN